MLPLVLSTLLPLLLCFFFINLYFKKSSNDTTPARLLPGPRPMPVIGNLHMLTSLPHRAVAGLSKAYGPLLLLRLGSIPTVFISSPWLAKQALKAHDVAVSGRPFTEAAGILSYGRMDMIFDHYGPRWRMLRRLFNSNLLSAAKIEACEFVRREEVRGFVESLREAAQAKDVVDVTAKV